MVLYIFINFIKLKKGKPSERRGRKAWNLRHKEEKQKRALWDGRPAAMNRSC